MLLAFRRLQGALDVCKRWGNLIHAFKSQVARAPILTMQGKDKHMFGIVSSKLSPEFQGKVSKGFESRVEGERQNGEKLRPRHNNISNISNTKTL